MSEKKSKSASVGKTKLSSSSSSEQISNVVIIREESHQEARLNLGTPLKDIITTGIQPVSYEDELVSKKNEIKRDPLRDILLFPADDVVLFKRNRELRTEYSTVPPQAFKDATSLFVNECLNVYTCDHVILDYKYKDYSTSYNGLRRTKLYELRENLRPKLFEMDVDLDETDGGDESMLVPTKENGIYKEGYLTKSPFHSDGNPLYGSKLVETVASQTYKRRWFTLKQTSNDGSYILEYRKEEGSAFAKGTLYLDSCTQIRKGVKGRMYGFELHIQDKVYGLAADSLSEMESWVKALCKATGIEIEQEKPLRSLFSGKTTQPKHKNLRESLKNSSHPLLQEYAKETDHGNLKLRQENRKKIFSIYPDLKNSYGILNGDVEQIEPFRESLGYRLQLTCDDLRFKLCNQAAHGKTANCEPFFVTLALFDVKQGRKVSEDFNCNLNEKSNKEMLLQNDESAEQSNNGSSEGFVNQQQGKDQEFHSPKTCVFSVDVPHADIFLVLRVNKVLQGGIGQCTESYIKSYDNPKTSQKLTKQMKLVCKRLAKFKMPFGWAARPVFKNADGDLDIESSFTPIFKQETAKLTDEEMLKNLQDLRSDSKSNKQVIPGCFECTMSSVNPNVQNCYSPSLIPLKPFSRSSEGITPSLEVQTFCQRKTEFAIPYTDYVNNFYVYPVSLNYGSQKTFKVQSQQAITCSKEQSIDSRKHVGPHRKRLLSKGVNVKIQARNIACRIEFKDNDEIASKPLKCIYQRDGSCTFTHQITCPVLYHNTTPTFYEEIKILLPPQIEAKHHVLFTFYHVSVEQPKEGKETKKEILTPVGYSWMPILDEGIIRGDESNLPVALYLPERYLTTQNVGLGKHTGPDVKWVGGKEQALFKTKTNLVSTIYSQDPHINKFFAQWQANEGRQVSSADVETSRLLKLMHAADVYVVIKFLPVLLNQLFKVLIQVNNEDVAVNVVSLLIRITSMMYEVNKSHLLKSYVKYNFQVESKSGKTVHEELSKHLIFYLKLGADPTMISNILQHSWFFFDIMVKSMAYCYMTKTPKPEVRQSRFKASFLTNLENLVQVFIYQLVSKSKDKQSVVKEANQNLGSFIKNCISHMDRGHVFQIVNYLKDQYQPADTQMLELKFDFLRSICEHEHYIALNLPFDIRVKGDVHESVLNEKFYRQHYLVGLLLREISEALYQPKVIRKFALKVLRNILVKHELDERYQSEEVQNRIAALYIPFMTMMLEQSIRFHKDFDRQIIDDTVLSLHRIASVPNACGSPVTKRLSTQSQSVGTPSIISIDPSGKTPPILPFEDDECREFMICFLYVVKNLKSVIIVDWWRDILTTPIKRPRTNSTVFYYVQHEKHFAKFMAIIDFFDLLECCIKIFKYTGVKTAIEERTMTKSESTKQFLETKYASVQKPSPRLSMLGHRRQNSNASVQSNPQILSTSTSTEFTGSNANTNGDKLNRVLLESNLSSEVALIALDMLELFCAHFKFHLEQDEGDNVLMKKLFNVLMTFLRIGQSEDVMKHVFASLRSFIHKFPTALFKGNANLCGVLCYEILRLCNSKIETVRTQACCFMYLLMRSNFEYSGKGCVRVHHQVIVAVSKLIASGMNRGSMSQSLIMLKNYAVDDKGMKEKETSQDVDVKNQSTEFPGEVRDLIKKVHTVLQATAQMKEHEDDLEVLVDLQYSLAKSYSSTPDLRQTWLQSMANIHEKNGDYSEASMCYIHAAALVAEYLKGTGHFPGGCSVFKPISPNLIPDETASKDETAISELLYTPKHLLDILEICIDRLKVAERYEIMGEIYKLAIPLYEQDRNYQALALAYGTLKEAYEKVVQVMVSGKRVLGRYYRVAFYGRSFKSDDGKEFIYKEPKLTSLPEVSQRLEGKYSKKYGNVKLIQDSSKVKPEELNPAVNYIQVTFVQPYFDEDEYEKRQTEFERENNIRRFVFETPFTLSGKARGALSEQHKRKTILTTSHCFPYVKKRILVVQQEQYELSPIEVAIDEMQNKVKELNHVIALDPPDMKKLQLKLAGSVSVQVNAGPLAYAQTFLDPSVVKNYMAKHVEALQEIYGSFVVACGQAIELNGVLIKPDQVAYHQDIKERYADLRQKVATFIGEEFPYEVSVLGSPTHSSEA